MTHGRLTLGGSGRSAEREQRAKNVTRLSDYATGRGVSIVSAEVRASADPVHARDVLDEAVRGLAISTPPLLDRLLIAGEVLRAGVTRRDFVEREDRRLFEKVLEDLGDLKDAQEQELRRMGNGALESIAEDVVDLRDALIGRAIRRASLPNS